MCSVYICISTVSRKPRLRSRPRQSVYFSQNAASKNCYAQARQLQTQQYARSVIAKTNSEESSEETLLTAPNIPQTNAPCSSSTSMLPPPSCKNASYVLNAPQPHHRVSYGATTTDICIITTTNLIQRFNKRTQLVWRHPNANLRAHSYAQIRRCGAHKSTPPALHKSHPSPYCSQTPRQLHTRQLPSAVIVKRCERILCIREFFCGMWVNFAVATLQHDGARTYLQASIECAIAWQL